MLDQLNEEAYMTVSPADSNTMSSGWNEKADFRKSKVATALVFFLNGLLISSWVPHIPYVKDALNLTSSELGVALLSISVGALFSMYLTGVLVPKFGTKVITYVSAYFMCVAVVGPIVSQSHFMLLLALTSLGIANGALDVTMNTDGVEVESKLERPTMSFLHAMFSFGALAGASIAVASTSLGLSPPVHIVGIAALGASLVVVYSLLRPSDWAGAKATEKKFALPNRSIMLVALLTFVVLSSEGVITDWSGVFLAESLNVKLSKSGIGYLIFAFSMAGGRLLGDKVVSYFGRRQVLRIGSLLAILGMAAVVAIPSVLAACVGFAMLGLGLSNITPVLFSIAGASTKTSPSLAVAAVASAGYFGFLVAPPLVGFIADWKGLHYAFTGFGCSLLLILIFSRRVVSAH